MRRHFLACTRNVPVLARATCQSSPVTAGPSQEIERLGCRLARWTGRASPTYAHRVTCRRVHVYCRHPDKISADADAVARAHADERMKEINTAYARLAKGDDDSDDDCDDIFSDFDSHFGGAGGIPTADMFMFLCALVTCRLSPTSGLNLPIDSPGCTLVRRVLLIAPTTQRAPPGLAAKRTVQAAPSYSTHCPASHVPSTVSVVAGRTYNYPFQRSHSTSGAVMCALDRQRFARCRSAHWSAVLDPQLPSIH